MNKEKETQALFFWKTKGKDEIFVDKKLTNKYFYILPSTIETHHVLKNEGEASGGVYDVM